MSLYWAQIISLISAAASTTPLQDLPPPLPLLLDVPCPDVEADPVLLCFIHQEDCKLSLSSQSPLNALASAM